MSLTDAGGYRTTIAVANARCAGIMYLETRIMLFYVTQHVVGAYQDPLMSTVCSSQRTVVAGHERQVVLNVFGSSTGSNTVDHGRYSERGARRPALYQF